MLIAPDTALIGLGANLGDGAATIRAALCELQALPECNVLQTSSLYRSAPVDAQGPDYWNAVAALRCGLAPERLLGHLQRIEHAHGRVRRATLHNAPRTLDLDLLLFGSQHLRTAMLILPHPRMHQRVFVLAPLAEIWPDWTLPNGESLLAAVQRLRNEGQIVQHAGPIAPEPS